MELRYSDFPRAYTDLVYLIQRYGSPEATRNGSALVFPEPVLLTIYDPTRRVVADAARNANPFFHVMETVWMFAGHSDPRWLVPFNKRILDYADIGLLGNPIINGAYGYRWRRHWGDQLSKIIGVLRADPMTRQAVLEMWDPHLDLGTDVKDRPCNTHIYFRNNGVGGLDMSICNRSNDLIWGMMGANAVHMSYLHELIATAAGFQIGDYRVFTNNLHFYIGVYPNEQAMLTQGDVLDTIYPADTLPLLRGDESWQRFLLECKLFCDNKFDQLTNRWLLEVAQPMYEIYRKVDGCGPEMIGAEDWRKACSRWLLRNRDNAML